MQPSSDCHRTHRRARAPRHPLSLLPRPLVALQTPHTPARRPDIAEPSQRQPRSGCLLRHGTRISVPVGSTAASHGCQESGAEAGPARQQGQAEGAQSRIHSPWHRLHLRGHEGPEAHGGGPRRPRRRRQQAAQGRQRRHPLRRPGQGGEEGRQEGRE